MQDPLWFDSDYNSNGSALDDAYTILDCCLLNTYCPTRIDSETSIDITLASPGLVPETSWTLRPVLIKLYKPKQVSRQVHL